MFYLLTVTVAQTPCGPGNNGECDITGECLDGEVECNIGKQDCILETSACCFNGTTAPDACE